MSALTFKAVIGGVRFDPKKGIVKIQLEATSYVSLDALTTLGPQDESIRVTLESKQTRIDSVGDPIVLDEEGAERLGKAARELRDSPDGPAEEEHFTTEFPTEQAVDDKEAREAEGGDTEE